MQETYNEIWREIASGIRLHLSADAFQRWFSAIELVQADEIALTFQVPNGFRDCERIASQQAQFLVLHLP